MQRIGATMQPQPRDDNRPVTDYPRYPQANCVEVSRYLAARYPELQLRVGVLRWRYRGLSLAMPHAWNVNAHGEIVDATWAPWTNVREVEYVESEHWTRACASAPTRW
jgi:hypothetical protein